MWVTVINTAVTHADVPAGTMELTANVNHWVGMCRYQWG